MNPAAILCFNGATRYRVWKARPGGCAGGHRERGFNGATRYRVWKVQPSPL